jgi:hypothetical protein
MAALAGVLSFGEIGGEGELVRELTPVDVNLRDLRNNESPFLSMAATLDALFSIRGRTIDGVKVSSLLVTWVNVPDMESNPHAETGYLCSKVFGHAEVAP